MLLRRVRVARQQVKIFPVPEDVVSPMSMVTRPSLVTVAASIPLSVSMLTWGEPRSATSSAATQRAALPQAPTSPPSAFQMRMRASACSDASVASRRIDSAVAALRGKLDAAGCPAIIHTRRKVGYVLKEGTP